MSPAADIAAELSRDLRAHSELCQQTLALLASESHALSGATDYDAFGCCQRRKGLLPAIEESLNNLRRWRRLWQQVSPEERGRFADVSQLFQTIQGFMMRILLLDRENQQAMLRRGLVPAQHLPAAASQQSHFVAGVYRRHSAG